MDRTKLNKQMFVSYSEEQVLRGIEKALTADLARLRLAIVNGEPRENVGIAYRGLEDTMKTFKDYNNYKFNKGE